MGLWYLPGGVSVLLHPQQALLTRGPRLFMKEPDADSRNVVIGADRRWEFSTVCPKRRLEVLNVRAAEACPRRTSGLDQKTLRSVLLELKAILVIAGRTLSALYFPCSQRGPGSPGRFVV